MYHAARGNLPKLRRQTERGAGVNERDVYGRTSLILACAFGQIECARWLIAHGADVRATDDTGRTALFEVAIGLNGNEGVATALIEILLAHGAEVNTHDRHGRTPLSLVEQGGSYIVSLQEREDIAKLLKAAGAIE